MQEALPLPGPRAPFRPPSGACGASPTLHAPATPARAGSHARKCHPLARTRPVQQPKKYPCSRVVPPNSPARASLPACGRPARAARQPGLRPERPADPPSLRRQPDAPAPTLTPHPLPLPFPAVAVLSRSQRLAACRARYLWGEPACALPGTDAADLPAPCSPCWRCAVESIFVQSNTLVKPFYRQLNINLAKSNIHLNTYCLSTATGSGRSEPACNNACRGAEPKARRPGGGGADLSNLKGGRGGCGCKRQRTRRQHSAARPNVHGTPRCFRETAGRRVCKAAPSDYRGDTFKPRYGKIKNPARGVFYGYIYFILLHILISNL